MDEVLKAIEAQKGLIEGEFATQAERMEAIEKGIEDTDAGRVIADAANEERLKHLESSAVLSKGVSLPGVTEEKESFSFLKAVNAIKSNDWSSAGFEKEIFANTAEKALASGSGTAGGYMVPNEYIAEMIEMIRAESIVGDLGATYLNNLSGAPVEFPKQTGGATAHWVAENSAITESQQTFGQLTLSPKQVAAMTKVSNRLLKMSDPSVEAMVRRDIVKAISLAVDLAALRGSGTENEPMGIANTPGILNVDTVGADGGPFLFETAGQMEGALEDANALRGRLGFAWNPKIKRLLKQEKILNFSGQTTGEPYQVGLPAISDDKLRDILGYDFRSSTQIPTDLVKGSSGATLSEIYFANWEELLIGSWGGLELMASSEAGTSFASNQTWIRVIQEVDMGLRHNESFCICNDATVTGA